MDNNIVESTNVKSFEKNGDTQFSEKYNFSLKNDKVSNIESHPEKIEDSLEEAFSFGEKSNTQATTHQSSSQKVENNDALLARQIMQKTIERIKDVAANPIPNDQKVEATLEIRDVQFGKINIQLSFDQNRNLELSIVSQNQELSEELENNIEELRESLSSHKITLNDLKISTQGTSSQMDSNAHQDSSKHFLADSNLTNSDNSQSSDNRQFKEDIELQSNNSGHGQKIAMGSPNQTIQGSAYHGRSINTRGNLSISA